MCLITLLKLDIADKLLIIYLYVCFVLWIISTFYNNEKGKKEDTEIIKPNTIYTNVFVAIRLWMISVDKRKLISDDDVSVVSPIKKYQINCSKIEFVRAVIKWCKENNDLNKNRAINLDLKYYKHKTLMGSYNYITKTITVYYNSHNSIESLVDTIIHEYHHSKEIIFKKHQIEYDKLSIEKTYYKNPYEVRARKAGAENRFRCIKDLYKLKYLK